MKCSKCDREMKTVGSHVQGNHAAVGYVCDCRHYAIKYLKRKTTYEVRSVSEWPALTLMGTLPVHRQILDRLHELDRRKRKRREGKEA